MNFQAYEGFDFGHQPFMAISMASHEAQIAEKIDEAKINDKEFELDFDMKMNCCKKTVLMRWEFYLMDAAKLVCLCQKNLQVE